jgi:sigma-B regulation protein RsbU (phosphoserine phosphatase)
MCRTEQVPEPDEEQDVDATDAAFTALLEDSAEELYEQAPCGYLSTLMDGTIAKVNTTLLEWWGGCGSPTFSPWAASSTTRPTTRRFCR